MSEIPKYKTSHTARKNYRKQIQQTFKLFLPPPAVTVSQFADKYRRLSSEDSAEIGLWDTNRAPYQREMMDALNEPQVTDITMMCSVQVGKTAMILNMILYHICLDPAPILYVLPTEGMAKSYSKDRFMSMVRDSPILRDKLSRVRTKENDKEVLHKKFVGGQLSFGFAQSPTSLGGRPIRLLFLDEVDKYALSAGVEGDPVILAKARTTTFWNKKIVYVSTPTVTGRSKIHELFLQSDQRYFHLPCPKCNHFQKLTFQKGIKFERDGNKKLIPDSVRYMCEKCNTLLTEADKIQMLAKGKWVAEHPEIIAHRGYHISALYSPFISWAEVVEQFLTQKKYKETLKEFANTVLGELWNEADEVMLNTNEITEKAEVYQKVPMKVLFLTCGIDVQHERIELVVRGWGMGEESWLVDYKILYGTTTAEPVWRELAQYLQTEFEHESGIKMPIQMTAIDSADQSTIVYSFVLPRQGSVRAVKGHPGGWGHVDQQPFDQTGGIRLYMLGTWSIKKKIYDRLKLENAGPGYIHFNKAKCDKEYFKQLTSHTLKTHTNKSGQTEQRWYKPASLRDEALDCEVYAYAAMKILNPDFDAIYENRQKAIEELRGMESVKEVVPAEPEPVVQSPVPFQIPRPENNYFKVW